MKYLIYFILFTALSFLGYKLVPNQVFTAGYWWLAIPFVVLFALISTCSILSLNLTIKNRGSKKGIIASLLGLGALQVCGLSAYACSTALGFTVLATILPHTVLNIFQQYSLTIIILSILIQVYAVVQLNCFKIFFLKGN